MSRTEAPSTFGELLRRARQAAGLTQDELAERAGLSARGISDLERGKRRLPRRSTFDLLMDALGLTDPERLAWQQARMSVSSRSTLTDQASQPGNTTSIIGRDGELRLARPLIDGLAAGSGSVVALAGDPGIGKTRLAQELAADALRRGAAVHWGPSAETEGTPAYWPWMQIIRAWLLAHDDMEIREDLGSGAAAIATIVSEIGERLPDLPALAAMQPEQARFRLFESVMAWLQRAADRRPLALVFDDLHWADSASLRLLQFIAPRLHEAPLLVIVSYRDFAISARPALRETLDALNRQPTHLTIQLRGWNEPDVAQIIEQIAGTGSVPAIATTIHQRTDGNPFFVIELVRLLVAGGVAAPGEQEALRQIPGSVRSAIRQRVGALSAPCQELLETAAVIGRDFSLPVLAGASQQPVERVVDLLDEAAGAHLTLDLDASGQSRFTHALISETLVASIGAARRMRLHASVAVAIERVQAGDGPARAGDIAHHYRMAAPIGYAAEAIEYSIVAAERAMNQAAWETAIDHHQHALDAFDLLPRPDTGRRLELLLALGETQNIAAGLLGSAAARATFKQAARLARQLNAPDRFARAAFGFAGLNPLMTTGGIRQVELLDEARAMLGTEENPLAARVLARLATSLIDRGLGASRDLARARDLSDAAVAMARRLDDSPTLVHALLMWHVTHADPDEIAARLEATAEAIRLAEASGAREWFAWAHDLRCNDLLELGAIEPFEEGFRILRDVAGELRLPGMEWSVLNRQAMRAQSAGHYERAEELIEQMRMRRLTVDRASILKLFFLRREQGRLAEIAGQARERYGASDTLLALAFMLILDIDTGRLETARATLDRIAVDRYERLERDANYLLTLALHAEACHALDDRDRAGVLFGLLGPYANRNVGANGNLFLGAAACFLGLLAATRRDWDHAERQFRDAIAINTRLGMPAYVAYARYAYADTLMRRGHRDDRDTIAELLNQALATAIQLGMPPLQAKALALSEALGDSHVQPSVSSRERDVLRLLAEGRSNQEIAATLAISPHTAATHVTNILNKLGLESRAAAAAWAVRHGIT